MQATRSDSVPMLKSQIQKLAKRKPPLKAILDAFSTVLIAGAALRAERLEGRPVPDLTVTDPMRLAAGVPLWHETPAFEAVPHLADGLKAMLMAVQTAFPPLKPETDALLSRLEADGDVAAAWLKMLIRNERDSLEPLAGQIEIRPETLCFILEQAFKPFLGWLASGMTEYLAAITWDKGYCPVCGAYPATSFLKKAEEAGEYLVAQSGQRWLHCGVCGHEWRLHRVHCPYCDNQDSHTLEYLSDAQAAHEKLYICKQCNKYLTCLDTAELVEKPPSELIGFELLHLEMIAQQKGFAPMAWRHWNQMGG